MIFLEYNQMRKRLKVNVCVPKCKRSHNVELGTPADVSEALEMVKLDTGLDLSKADIISCHFTLTWDSHLRTEHLEKIIRPVRGFALAYGSKEDNNTLYLQSPKHSKGRLAIAIYEKVTHLNATGKSGVLKDYGLGQKTLPRIETRFNFKVRGQLVERGLWKSPYLLAEDLITPEAFHAFAKLFHHRVSKIILPKTKQKHFSPKDRSLLYMYSAQSKTLENVLSQNGLQDVRQWLESNWPSFEQGLWVEEVRSVLNESLRSVEQKSEGLLRQAA